MLPVKVHLPVVGLYNSALVSPAAELSPPATSTWPLGSRVAPWPARAMFMVPVFAHVPEFPAKAGRVVVGIDPMANKAANTSLRTAADLGAFLEIMTSSYRRAKRQPSLVTSGGLRSVSDRSVSAHKIVTGVSSDDLS